MGTFAPTSDNTPTCPGVSEGLMVLVLSPGDLELLTPPEEMTNNCLPHHGQLSGEPGLSPTPLRTQEAPSPAEVLSVEANKSAAEQGSRVC